MLFSDNIGQKWHSPHPKPRGKAPKAEKTCARGSAPRWITPSGAQHFGQPDQGQPKGQRRKT